MHLVYHQMDYISMLGGIAAVIKSGQQLGITLQSVFLLMTFKLIFLTQCALDCIILSK